MVFDHAGWVRHTTGIANTLSNTGLHSLFFLYCKSKPGRMISFSVDEEKETLAFAEIKNFMASEFNITTSENGLCTLGGMCGTEPIDSITYIELIATNLEHFSTETIKTLEQICERVDGEMMQHRKMREHGTTPQ
jgi:hypothetical protein